MNSIAFDLGVEQQELQQVIQQLIGVVNNQGKAIQSLQKELATKAEHQAIGKAFLQLGEAFSFNDAEVRKTLRMQQANMNKHTGKALEDNVDRMAERLFLLSKGWDYSIDINRAYADQIKKLDKVQSSKGDVQYIKRKNKKNKKWTQEALSQMEERLNRKLTMNQQEQKRDCLRVEAALKENEKKTLWKIQDCEQLLINRVNEEFVDKAIRTMDGKIVREINHAVDERLKEVHGQIDDNRIQAQQGQMEQNERTRRLERQFMEETARVKETYMERQIAENQNRRNEGILEMLKKRAEELESRGNANQVESKLEAQIGILQDQLSGVERRVKSVQTGVEELSKGLEGSEGGSGSMEHAVCALEFGLKQVRDQTEELDYQLKRVDRQLEIKYQFMEQSVQDQLNQLKHSNDDKEDLKEEFIKITEMGNAKTGKEIANFGKRVNEVEDRVEQIGKVEPRVDRLEEANHAERLADLLEEKVGETFNKKSQIWESNSQHVKKEIAELKGQLDELGDALGGLQQQLQGAGATEEVVSVFAHKNQVQKLRCMACGVQYMSSCKQEGKGHTSKQNNELYQLPYGKVTPQEAKRKHLS